MAESTIYAIQDKNQFPGLIGHTKTTDDSDLKRIVVNPDGSLLIPTGAATSANQTNGTQVTKIKETAPTDSTKVNGSYVLTRNGSGYITSIAQTIGTTTYTKTITRDVNNYITGISTWV